MDRKARSGYPKRPCSNNSLRRDGDVALIRHKAIVLGRNYSSRFEPCWRPLSEVRARSPKQSFADLESSVLAKTYDSSAAFDLKSLRSKAASQVRDFGSAALAFSSAR
jgi:hypothetical protein